MIDDIDKFLANVSDTMPTADQILHVGQPWGALHEKLTGSKLAKGLYFNVSKTGEAAPWLELIEDGKFSAQTLKLTRKDPFISEGLARRLLVDTPAGHGVWSFLIFSHAPSFQTSILQVVQSLQFFLIFA